MDTLVEEAWRARERAYTPYSHYPVGAAVEDEAGRRVGGANIENASYGLSICAERVALTRARMEGLGPIVRVAVVAEGPAPSPCGACRQFMAELAKGAKVVYENRTQRVESTVEELLPGAFSL